MEPKQKILIVDDSEINRAMLKEILGEGYEYLEAENGLRAIEILRRRTDIALVLLDLIMPEMDGFDVLRVMKYHAWLDEIPVIVISAAEDTANIERGIDTSGILTMDYNSFRAVCMAAKDCGAPARYVIQGTKGYILQKSTANWCGGVTFHPNEGREEHFNLNGGKPRQAAEFHAFARAIAGGDQELCSRMLDTSVAVSKVLTVARRSAGLKF